MSVWEIRKGNLKEAAFGFDLEGGEEGFTAKA
jgi:hypothetical protein